MKSPFESKIPAHIQRSLSSLSDGDPQPALSRPCNSRGHRVSADRANSLAALTHGDCDMGVSLAKARRVSSIPAHRFRNVHADISAGCGSDLQIGASFFQSPLDGRCVHH